MRKVVCGIVIENDRILLVRKNETYLFPGGKPELGETDRQCLEREFAEELSGTRIEAGLFYGEFQGKAPHMGDQVSTRTYFGRLERALGKPSGEISEAGFYDIGEAKTLNLSESTRKTIESLRENHYL